MGSVPSSPPTSPENSAQRYWVFASFCLREVGPNINNSNWMERYDPCGNAWTHVTFIPGLEQGLVLKDFAMESIGGSIYIIGGRLCRKERAHVTDETADIVDMNIEVLSSVWRYDVHVDRWSSCASLHVPRYDFACAVCGSKIYVAGGQSTLAGGRGIWAAEMYDVALNEWTPLPNMSTRRYKCVGLTWHGKIHVVGGFADRGDSDRVVPYIERSSAEVYDAEVGRWDHVAGMWQLDVPPNQIIPVDGKLFSSGDCLNAWKGHIEAYDGKLNIWNIVDGSQRRILSNPASTSSGSEEIQRQYLTIAPIGTQLYFLAGYRTGGERWRTISTVHVFDTSANGDAWRSQEPMEQEGERELCSHCCVVQLS